MSNIAISSRRAEVERNTKETKIRVTVDLDGSGTSKLASGIGFFDHMLEQIARHGAIDLTIEARGDLRRRLPLVDRYEHPRAAGIHEDHERRRRHGGVEEREPGDGGRLGNRGQTTVSQRFRPSLFGLFRLEK